MRSSVGDSSWSASSHFLEARGRAVQLGTTAVGSLSPPMPALIRPPPLSKTTTFDIAGDGLGSWRGNGFSDRQSFCFYFNNLFPATANINYSFLRFLTPLQSSNYKNTQISLGPSHFVKVFLGLLSFGVLRENKTRFGQFIVEKKWVVSVFIIII